MSSRGLEIAVGDVLAFDGRIGIATALYRDGDEVGAIVEVLAVSRWVAQHSAVVRRTGGLEAWAAAGLVCCIGWKPVGDREMLVVCQ